MKTFSELLAICAGNSLVTGEFPAQRPVTQSFDVFFDLRLNKQLSKQTQTGKLVLARSPMRVKYWLGEWKRGMGKWNYV